MALSFVRRYPIMVVTLVAASLVATQFALGGSKHKPGAMDQRQRAAHALSRLTFGARPGDVDRVARIGVDKWIEQQLHPERTDDPAMEARVAQFRTLGMSTRDIVENFPNNALIRQVADGKVAMPSDPTLRAIYTAQVQRLDDKQERKEEAAQSSGANQGDGATMTDAVYQRRREANQAATVHLVELLDLAPDERYREIMKLSPEEQRSIANRAKGPKADALLGGMSGEEKETLRALNGPEQVVVDELTQAKLLRAIYSEHQLDEVMADFWFNHFNVFINKGADRFLLTSYERDVIRPHVLGKFEDLLVATAESPAMLFYLDNWLSVGPNSDVAMGIGANARDRGGRLIHPPKGKPKQASGLNENYGRELMELHTLSVNGGYSQKDVTEVAKVFTGWTIEQPNRGGGFKFEPRMHEPGDKMVMGHRIKENGEQEGWKCCTCWRTVRRRRDLSRRNSRCGLWPTIHRQRWWSG